MATEDTKYITVYAGSEVNVQHLQHIFERYNIDSIVRNNFQSGLRSGFGGGLPGQVQLLVHKTQEQKAVKIVEEVFPVADDEG